MKKVISFLLILSLVPFCLFACSDTEDNGKIKVVATIFPQYDFAGIVGGEYCDVQMLMSPGSDSHSYSGDNPSDILKIADCDLFIYTGGESDAEWVDGVLKKVFDAGCNPQTVSLFDVCEILDEENEGIIEAEEEEGEHGGHEGDEHVWTTPKNAELAVYAVRDALCGIDPAHSDYYTSNAEEYAKKLQALDEAFCALSQNAGCKTLVFADRFPFLYFAKEYGFECYAAFNGCASQSEPSPTAIVKLCRIIEENGLKNVFYTETSQSSVPTTISNATGAVPTLLHSCHTVTQKQLDSGISYLELMNMNLENLKEALQ